MSRQFIVLSAMLTLMFGYALGDRIASAQAPGSTVPPSQGMRPPPAAATNPPFDLSDPKAVEEGSHLFRRSCTGYCHGSEGRVSRAPALRGKEYDPRFLYQRIAGGQPPMPAFQTLLAPEDIWKLVAYIMSLRDAKEG
jgi:mono/diheme cytochrome c family protein